MPENQKISLDKASVPEGHRVYAIGDIHGRLDLLSDLLQRIEQDSISAPGLNKKLIFLGDYVDRGPDSKAVIETLLGLEIPGFEIITLLGNHESRMTGFAEKPLEDAPWLVWGGMETLASYGVDNNFNRDDEVAMIIASKALRSSIPDAHWNFLKSLPRQQIVGDYMFVHAGINPANSLEDQDPEDLIWIRGEFLHNTGLYEKVIVHGHSISDAPECHPNRIGIDTGAYRSDKLTCVVLEGNSVRFIDH
jgi:diadenosine tetraphosphatase ApaH/serine/threonine PP2A family protein phosphatase